MTSRVTVTALCGKEKQVQVTVISGKGSDKGSKNFLLEDQETQDYHVYDDRCIQVKEVVKKVVPEEAVEEAAQEELDSDELNTLV